MYIGSCQNIYDRASLRNQLTANSTEIQTVTNIFKICKIVNKIERKHCGETQETLKETVKTPGEKHAKTPGETVENS